MATKIDVYNLPNYQIAEAAHNLGIPVSTLRAWFRGQKGFKRIFAPSQMEPPLLSFINLVEAYVLASIRREYKISMPKVRKAIQYVSKEFPSKYPLAEQRLETDGVSLFLWKSGTLLNITQEGQLAIQQVMKPYLSRIEREPEGMAVKLYPFRRSGKPDEPKLIVINPEISFGRPIIVNTRIPTEVIAERYLAGESISELAYDYDLKEAEIDEALRYEFWDRRAA